jgi:hypothetical protein
MSKRLVRCNAVAGLVLMCASNALALTGRVVEQGTNRPVEGAFVAATWNGQTWNPVQAATTCYHIELRQTDAQGRFHVSDFSGNWNPFISDRQRSVSVYAPGKTVLDARDDDTVFTVGPRAGTREEQFAKVTIASISTCLDATDKRLLPMWKAYREELASLAVTMDQKRRVLDILARIDEIEVGREQASKNHAARLEVLLKSQRDPGK